MSVTVSDLVVYHYEKQPSDYAVGEILHNFNGNDYRIMERYSDNNLLLMQMNTGMLVVAVGVDTYMRHPKDDVQTVENTEMGIEWGSGIYLGNDLPTIDFKKLREEYGMPPEPNERGEYEIEISETLSRTETVKAESYYDALENVRSRYDRSEIVLDADSFSSVEFAPKNRGR